MTEIEALIADLDEILAKPEAEQFYPSWVTQRARDDLVESQQRVERLLSTIRPSSDQGSTGSSQTNR